MHREHGICASVKRNVSSNCGVAYRLKAAFGTQPLELRVQIKYHRRVPKPPRITTGAWMKAHDEEAASANAHA